MTAYYNEFDPFAAAWLRELIKDSLIADGVVDERSICDVEPNELKEFTQCHFFAGIGGWSYALRLANWSDERPVWTGSPPCQPFSTAGKGKGKEDERHLWPIFFNLIRECNPSVVFGEQVASAIRHGWFDDLQIDMEAENYASGMVVLPAASVGAPHKRDRLFYFAKSLADTNDPRPQGHGGLIQKHDTQGWEKPLRYGAEGGVPIGTVGNTDSNGQQQRSEAAETARQRHPNDSTGWTDIPLGNTEHNGSHGAAVGRGAIETSNNNAQGENIPSESARASRPEKSGNLRYWEDSKPIYCRDGKFRPIPTESALFPLANGIPNRVGILRGAGNAIVPQVAAEVIKAFMELANA